MAQPLARSKLGVKFSACARCSALLRTSISGSQMRRSSIAPQAARLLSSGRASWSPRDSYEANRAANGGGRWVSAASGTHMHPGSARSTSSRPTSTITTSYALYASPLRRSTPRACYYSSTAGAPSSSTSSAAGQSARPEPPDHLDEKERAIFDRLNDALAPIELQVEDISGGCGSMYAVAITADKFKGLPVIKQHRLVNEVLGEDIKSWHGIQLRTKAP